MEDNSVSTNSLGINPETPIALRLVAQFISYLFHPVFLPLYMMGFFLYVHPFQFLGFTPAMKLIVFVQAFSMYTFFPLVTVGLLKGLNFIGSLKLPNRKDRVIPLVACGIWYFWIWYVWRNIPEYPRTIVHMALGIWITASVGLFINAYMKISLHGMSVGALLLLMVQLSITQPVHFGWYLTIAILITGLVSTARLLASDHKPAEVYVGLLTGIISMFLAGFFV
jgi:hypothetical protein